MPFDPIPQNPRARFPVRLTGRPEWSWGNVTGVSLELDTGETFVAESSDNWQSWWGDVTFPKPGWHQVTAVVTQQGGGVVRESLGVQVDDWLELTVLSSTRSATLDYVLQVRAVSPGGVSRVFCEIHGGPGIDLSLVGGDVWSGVVALPVTNPVSGGGAQPVPIVVIGVPVYWGLPVSPSITVDVQAVDGTPPVVVWDAPLDGAVVEVLGDGSGGARAVLAARVSDPAGRLASSGLPAGSVKCTLDPGTAAAQTLNLPLDLGSDPAVWRGVVTFAERGPHTLVLEAVDNAGNRTTLTRTIVVRELRVDGTARQDYLTDLLDFASNRLRTGAKGRRLNPADVEEALRQPVLGLVGAGGRTRPPERVVGAPVNAVRGVIEVLRGYLTPRPPPAVARWPLDEGSGSVLRDDTGGGLDGTFVAGHWGSGRQGAAPVFDGASTYAEVGKRTELAVSGAVTVAAWVRPSGVGGAQAAVIAGRENCYLLARGGDGTIRWSLATAKPGWRWVDTGVPLAEGAWAHVAMAYDGAAARVYVNGRLANTVAASGPIQAAGPESDFRIGARQTVAQSFFAGSIADVGVYDRALSEYEIKLLADSNPAPDGVWVDDNVPHGVQTKFFDSEGWLWTAANPQPQSGARCHRSPAAAGVHQHYFLGLADGWPVGRGDVLYAHVFLDPANPPREIMLQWCTDPGGWEHRAYWGADLIAWGSAGPSRWAMGPLPGAGAWVRLEVPAALVGLESTTVRGLAFTLFDGQAWWDRAGKRDALAELAVSDYPAAAYAALLRALGTSLEELRAARAADAVQRQALAARLGIELSTARPDALDELLLPTTDVAEADLERLFGLARTEGDPLRGSAVAPQLLTWQQRKLRTEWAVEDYATTSADDYTPPVIDPDIVTDADFRDRTAAGTVYELELWQQRRQWIAGQVQTLAQRRAGQPTDAAALTAVLGYALPGFDVEAVAAERGAGRDIGPQLAAVQLDVDGFERLATLSKLASATPPLSDDEWQDVEAILVQVLKVGQFPAWRQAEHAAGLLLDPDVFQLGAATPQDLPAWRANWSTRLRWQQRLAGRASQLAELAARLTAAVATAERAALPVLRDAALSVAAPRPADRDALARRLCIDLDAGPELATNRLDQAIEAMQALLSGVDAGGGLARVDLPWIASVGSDQLRGEMSWMGHYASWTSAMGVFLWPENHLLPATRPTGDPTAPENQTRPFRTLVEKVTDPLKAGLLSPAAARAAAGSYWNDIWQSPPWGPSTPAGVPPAGDRDYPYTEQLSGEQLGALAAAERQLCGRYGSWPEIPNWLREVFFELPLQLALGLAQAREWRAALDWLRIVWNRDAPPGQRAVFAGFGTADSAPPTRDVDWLKGGLDAFALAATRPSCYLRFTLLSIAGILCDWADHEFATDTAESRSRAASLYAQALDVLADPDLGAAGYANPEWETLARRGRLGRARLHAGLNIAGLSRPLADLTGRNGAAALPSPTNYRYTTLIARAQQVLASAGQIESTYLASLERRDAESYQVLLAGQDLGLARARVKIATQQATIAADEAAQAKRQVERAQTQSATYGGWLAAGRNDYEQAMLRDYQSAQVHRSWAAHVQAALPAAQGIAGIIAGVATANPAVAASSAPQLATAAGIELGAIAENAATQAQVDAAKASWERREQEWGLQKALADIDVQIASEQRNIADKRAAMARDEADVASTVQAHTEAKLAFLQTKFTSRELYTWMSGVLSGVYRYLLQQAAATARLAEQQLAFERQAPVPGHIKSDYWSAAGAPAAGSGGLTGSARLLEDITQLEQYAFDTNRRKDQATQTFSLARLGPVDFQRFRETGVLPFAIPLDRYGVPGMYLGTIRRVRVSVAALIPPDQGIRATLAGGASSRIVVEDGDGFRTVTLARRPETVILTAPANASGVFDIDLTPDLQLPWEGCGLDLPFELRLPKAINAFDYRTLADVQITVDYTALYSGDFAAQVIRTLPRRTSNSIGLSLRDFADAWYELLQQARAQAATPNDAPLLARWELTDDDFPNNLIRPLNVEQITLLIVRRGTAATEFSVEHLRRNGLPTNDQHPTATTSVGDIVSTRNGSGAAWNNPALIGADPVGSWEVGLAANATTVRAIADGHVDDLVLELAYGAALPDWPI
jgi:hypothetical protein